MSGRHEADPLVEAIIVDCYGLAEQVTAFYEVIATEVPLPTLATVVGTAVQVVDIDIAEDGEGFLAGCRRDEVEQTILLSELVFPPDTAAGWLRAAYRRCLGLAPHPAAPPQGWKPSWL